MVHTAVVTEAREAAHKVREQLEHHMPKAEAAKKRVEKHAFPIAAGLAAGSVLLSLSLFGKRSKDSAIFVGLWAPTLLSLGLFYMLAGPGKSHTPED